MLQRIRVRHFGQQVELHTSHLETHRHQQAVFKLEVAETEISDALLLGDASKFTPPLLRLTICASTRG
jgi:hypothetical protein